MSNCNHAYQLGIDKYLPNIFIFVIAYSWYNCKEILCLTEVGRYPAQ